MRVSPKTMNISHEDETSSFGTGPNTARGAIGSQENVKQGLDGILVD